MRFTIIDEATKNRVTLPDDTLQRVEDFMLSALEEKNTLGFSDGLQIIPTRIRLSAELGQFVTAQVDLVLNILPK